MPRNLASALAGASALLQELSSQDLTSSSFDILGDWLLKVADAIAQVNRVLLSTVALGERIDRLEDSQWAIVSDLMNKGMKIAALLMDAISPAAAGAASAPEYHTFLSYPGEEYYVYLAGLDRALQRKIGGIRNFVDRKWLQGCGDSRNEMLRQVLSAKVVVCVLTYHSAQKKWTIAELICAMARNARAVESGTVSPLLVDGTPGWTWLQSEAGRQRRPEAWVEDLLNLFPELSGPGIKSMSRYELPGTFVPCFAILRARSDPCQKTTPTMSFKSFGRSLRH